jgi:hypothetical protein
MLQSSCTNLALTYDINFMISEVDNSCTYYSFLQQDEAFRL